MNYGSLGTFTGNVVRLAEVVQVLAKHGFADLLQRAGLDQGLPAKVLRGLNLVDAPRDEPATFGFRLRAALTELGPTFIKFGQILSTRPDLVGNDLAEELSQLQDTVSPLPFETMRRVIDESLGEPYEQRFARIDPTPVACASLSQVYRGTLAGGAAVALKVQRPGAEKIIESDLSLMRQIAEWVRERVKDLEWMDPPGVVDEFARSIRRELDFEIEARILERVRENFADREADLFVPRIHPALCGKRLLTMDWVDGVRVDRFDAYEARRCDRKVVGRKGLDVLCRMVFEHHLFHADPHPGNVLITHDNQLALLDYGMAGHIERTDVLALAELLLALFMQNAAECVNTLLTLTTGEPEDRRALEHEVAEFIAFEAQMVVASGQVAKGIKRVVEILRKHRLQLAPRFSLLLKALATIETVGHQLDPEMNTVPVIQPYVERMVVERFKPGYVLREVQQQLALLPRLTRQIPDDIAFLLRQFRRGRLKVVVGHEDLERITASLDRASNRIAVGLLTAALIVGSSIVVATQSKLEGLGLGGFVFAGLLGVTLIASILWSRKF